MLLFFSCFFLSSFHRFLHECYHEHEIEITIIIIIITIIIKKKKKSIKHMNWAYSNTCEKRTVLVAISELVSRHIYKRTLPTKTIQFIFLIPEDHSGHKTQDTYTQHFKLFGCFCLEKNDSDWTNSIFNSAIPNSTRKKNISTFKVLVDEKKE